MLRLAVPSSWSDVMVRSFKVFVAAFLVFLVKEFIEVGRTDIPAGGGDALWVAVGTLLLNAILMFTNARRAAR